jgi:Tfp pilus assembly protein PilF
VRFSIPLVFLLSLVPASAHSTLVLPFFNRSQDTNLNWVGESIGETVRESLASYGILVVRRGDRLEAYRRHSIRPEAVLTRASVIKVASTLDAERVIYGHFELAPAADPEKLDTLRITARILDLGRMQQGPEFLETGPLEDLANIETRLGWQALQFLAPKVAPSEQEFFALRPPVRVDAIENYVRGLLATTEEQKHRFFTAAARLDEKFPQPRFQLGRIYFEKKDYRVASGWLEGVTPAESHYYESQFMLGLSRYYLGDLESAGRHFLLVAGAVPLNEVWNNLGAVQLRQGKGEAIESLRKALEGDDADPDYHFNLGYAHWKAGRFDDAVASFRAVVQRRPDDAEATVFLGRSLKQDGPRPGDTRSEGRERLKHEYQEDTYRQLQAVLAK